MLCLLRLTKSVEELYSTQHLPTSAPMADVTVFIFSTCSILTSSKNRQAIWPAIFAKIAAYCGKRTCTKLQGAP